MNLPVITQQNQSGLYWGIIEGFGNFMPTEQGETIEALIQNVKDCIEDYQELGGKQDQFLGWCGVE